MLGSRSIGPKSRAETGLGESSKNTDSLNTGRNSAVMSWLAGQAGKTAWQAEWRPGDDSDETGVMLGRQRTWSTGRQRVSQGSKTRENLQVRTLLPREGSERSGGDWSEQPRYKYNQR